MWEGFVVQALAKCTIEDERARLRDELVDAAIGWVAAKPPFNSGDRLGDAAREIAAFEQKQT
jgi:hypothetical protein